MAESVDLVARVDGAADLRGVVGCRHPPSPNDSTALCVRFFRFMVGYGCWDEHTVLPPATDDRDLLAALKAVLTGHEQVSISTPEGSVPLPDSVLGLLVDAVTALDQGRRSRWSRIAPY